MIKRIGFHIKNNGYEERLFKQFMLLVTFPLIVMGLLSYHIYINGESARNKLELDSYSENVVNEYENIFSTIRQYYLDGTSSSAFTWLVRQTEVPYSSYSEVHQAQIMLQGNYFMTKYIDMYNFINMKEGWVLNNYGMYPYDQLKNQTDTDAFIEAQKEISASIYWLNRSEIPSPYETAKESALVDTSGEMLVVKNEYSSGNIAYLLMIKLDMEEINSISGSYQKLGYHVTVLSGESVLIETESDLTNTYLESGSYQSGLYRSPKGKQYNIRVSEPTTSGLIYVVGYDTDQEKRDAIVFLYVALLLIAFFGILLLVLRIMAKYFSKPFVMLQNFVADQTIQIRELFVTNLIKGALDYEKIDSDSKKYNILPCHCYRIIGIVCKRKEQEPGPENPSGLGEWTNRTILTKLPDAIRDNLFIIPVIYENVVVFIIGEESDETIDYKTALVYKQVKDYVAETFGCQIASGISRIFHELPHVSRAYNECLKALHTENNLENGSNSTLVLYDDYATLNSAVNVYDLIMENELCGAIEGGNEEETRRLLELILWRMELKGVFGIERNYYINRLMMAILSIPGKSSIPLSDIFDDEQYNILSRVAQIYNPKDLLHYIEEGVVHPIVVTLEEHRKSEVSDIVKQIMKMIKENKGNITLNECAETLNYHPNYISKVLKKEKGITFTDMANAEKIKMAKYMLLTTDYSVAEISEKLQYNNVQNFIRFFKNQLGTTPSVFRKEHQE